MEPKLIALDLDETLLTSRKEISPLTREVLIEFQKKGGIVALASARPTPGIARFREPLELARYHGAVIAYNGARILDASDDTVLYEKNMDPEVVTAFLRHASEFPVTLMVDDGKEYYCNHPDGYKVEFERGQIGIPLKPVTDIAEAVTFPVPKMLVVAPGKILDANFDALTGPFKDQLDFFRVGDFYIESAVRGFSKAVGVRKLGEILGIPRENILAFGDSQNDAAMLKYAGLGAAMANGDGPSKEAADVVTKYDNNHDGIARFLTEELPNI